MAKLTANVDKMWFEDRIKDLGISQAEFGRRIGLGRSNLSRTLSGIRGTKVSEARKMAEVLGRPEHEVLKHLDMPDAAQNAGETADVFTRDRTARLAHAASGFSEGQARYEGRHDTSNDGEDHIAPSPARHPMFGCMKGLGSLESGYDLTQPILADWAEYEEKKYGPGSKLYDE